MLFRQIWNLLSNRNALQASIHSNPQHQNTHHTKTSLMTYAGGRAFFFTSRRSMVPASITVEAAWLSVLFCVVVLALFSFFQLFYLENRLQASMEKCTDQAVMFSAVQAHLSQELDVNGEVYEALGELLFTGVSGAVIEAQLEQECRELKMSGFCEIGDLQVDSLSLYSENGIVDLKVRYEALLPVLGKQSRMLRCRKGLWTGNAPTENSGEIVYVTVTGSVYHLYADCTHLKLSIREVSAGQVDALRNEGGGRYTACELCAEEAALLPTALYITEEGSRYHILRTCSSLKRSVLEIDFSQIGERPLCRRCAERGAS